MELRDETVKAIQREIELYRFAVKRWPNLPVSKVKECGCTGPLNECRCKKHERLLTEFLSRVEKTNDG